MKEFLDVKSVLTVGTKMFISQDSAEISDVMQARLVAVGNNEIALTIPVRNGFFIPLAKDESIEVYFYKGSGRYYFKTTITGRVLFGSKPVIKFEIPKSMIRTERRQYYRIETFFPIKLATRRIEDDEDDPNAQKLIITEYKANCIDISGGGLQLDPFFSEKIPLELDEVVEIDFLEALPGLSRAVGAVVREPQKKVGWGIKFTEINDSDRDKIIRYVFKKQLDLKKINEVPAG